jgi:NADH dehydrogenase
MLGKTDLPLDDRARLTCLPTLQIVERTDGDPLHGTVIPGAWSAGDCAAVPDLTAEDPATTMCSPSAQHAVRQARVLADNIIALLRGRKPSDYKHKYAGSVASLGLHKGVAYIYGVKLRGLPAWFMHRTYHMSRIPSFNRKVRVVADWTLALVLKREVVSLGELHEPRDPFKDVADPTL